MTRIQIEVPATSANIGPGFDALAIALDICNTVTAELTGEEGDVVLADPGTAGYHLDPHENLLCQAYRRWAEETAVQLPGIRFSLAQRIPIARGLGASAAAIVAGLAAAAFAAGDEHPRERITTLSSLMEGHADNAVAASLGGITVAFIDGCQVHAMQVATHLSLGIGLFVPDDPLLTIEARAALPGTVTMEDAVFNIGRAAFLSTALIWGRWERIGPAMRDRLHQPYRSRLLPALDDVIAAAIDAGAYGAALSGGGPSVIAIGPHEHATAFSAAMEECALARSWSGKAMVTGIRHLGVQVTKL